MQYNSDIHHRRSIRLKGYDYSQAGAYFVTICAQSRECLFGDVIESEMRVNNAGRMIRKWWNESAMKFNNIELDESVIMPNHFHGIINIVGAVLCGRPEMNEQTKIGQPNNTRQPHNIGQPRRVAPTVGNIVEWFKTMTTNEYIRNVRHDNWPPFSGKLWQRNYYEHIIRNEDELNRTKEYIVNNPARWAEDEENPAGRGGPMWPPV